MSKQRRCPLPATVFSGYEDACALGEAYASGKADPVAVAEACLERAEAVPAVYISIAKERCLAEARAAKARYALGCSRGLFDGTPIGWKDLYHVAGSVSTAGAELFRNNPPEKQDGPLVRLTSGAGMVCTGKLNTSEFAYSGLGYNPHYGTPANPHGGSEDPLIPGGSSSGSGVAVASGMVPVAMGTDTGGSLRVPAALNGIVGFRPTTGRYSTEGFVTLAPSLDTTGPMARSVRDIAVMDRILRGLPCCAPPVVPDLAGRRFVFDESTVGDSRIQDAVRDNLLAAVSRLEKAGAVVVRRTVAPVHESWELLRQGSQLAAEALATLDPFLADEAKAALLDPRVRKRAERGRAMPAATLVRILQGREKLIEAAKRDLADDILLMPVIGYVAPPIRLLEENMDVFTRYADSSVFLTLPGSIMKMPGIAMPTGTDSAGLPTGLQLLAATGEDERLLRVALAAEEAITRI